MTPEEHAQALDALWTQANKELPPHGDENYVDDDPWVQEKYRRGGQRELENYIRRTPQKELEQDPEDPAKTPEEVADGLKKADKKETPPLSTTKPKHEVAFEHHCEYCGSGTKNTYTDAEGSQGLCANCAGVSVDCKGCGHTFNPDDLDAHGFCGPCSAENDAPYEVDETPAKWPEKIQVKGKWHKKGSPGYNKAMQPDGDCVNDEHGETPCFSSEGEGGHHYMAPDPEDLPGKTGTEPASDDQEEYGDCGACGKTDEPGHSIFGEDSPHSFLCSTCYATTGAADKAATRIKNFSQINGKISPGFAYRAYKNSPHHPVSLFLKYSINRIVNADFYAKANPEEVKAFEEQWMSHHQQGGAADKNGHIALKDLQKARSLNPSFEAGLKRHQTKAHKYLMEHSPWLVKEVNGEPSIPLCRGYKLGVDDPWGDHDLSSYADDNGRARQFGSNVKRWWVPLNSVWFCYNIGPKSSSSNNFGPEDEWLCSNHKRVPAEETDVKHLVPRDHYGYAEPRSPAWKLQGANHHLTPAMLQTALESQSADTRALAARHPQLSAAQREAILNGTATTHRNAAPDSLVPDVLRNKGTTDAERMAFLNTERGMNFVLTRDTVLHLAPEWKGEHLKKIWNKAKEKEPLGPGVDWSRLERTQIAHRLTSLDNTPPETLRSIYNTEKKHFSPDLARNKNLPSDVIDDMTVNGTPDEKNTLYLRKDLTQEQRNAIEDQPFSRTGAISLLRTIADETTRPEVLQRLLDEVPQTVVGEWYMAERWGNNPHTPYAALEKAATLMPGVMEKYLYSHKDCPKEKVYDAFRKYDPTLATSTHNLGAAFRNPNLTSDDLNVALASKFPEVRGGAFTLNRLEPLLTEEQKMRGLLDEDPYVQRQAISKSTTELIEKAMAKADGDVLGWLQEAHTWRKRKKEEEGDDKPAAETEYSKYVRRRHGWGQNLNKSEDPDWFQGMLAVHDPVERHMALKSKFITPFHLRQALNDEDPEVRAAAIHHPKMTPELLREIIGGDDQWMAEEALKRPDLGPEDLEPALLHPELRIMALRHAACTPEQKQKALDSGELPTGLHQEVASTLVKNIGYLTYPGLGVTNVPTQPMSMANNKFDTYWKIQTQNLAARPPRMGIEGVMGNTERQTHATPEPSRVMSGAVRGMGHYAQRQAQIGGILPRYFDPMDPPKSTADWHKMKSTLAAADTISIGQRINANMGHEAQHSVFGRIRQRHGAEVGNRAAAETLKRIPEEQRLHVEKLFRAAHVNVAVHHDPEEQIAYLHNYLQDPNHRARIHTNLRIANNKEAQQTSMATARKAWQSLRQAAAKMQPEDIGLVYKSNKDEIYAYMRSLKKSRHVGDTLGDHLGFNPELEMYVRAAEFLTKVPRNEAKIRRLLWEFDGNALKAVAHAYELTPDAILGVSSLEGLTKAMSTTDIKAVSPNSQDIVESLQWAYANNQVEGVKLGGKHSTGSLLAHDKDGNPLLIKPGSGKNSPAAGVREEPASQSRREACFYALAQVLGLGSSVPRAEVVSINGQEVAVIEMLGLDWQGIFRTRDQDPNKPRQILKSYLERGVVHRWALLDYVAGQTDRHANNILVGPQEDGWPVALIDAGSAFAGPDFAPGRDQNSFVPYYLRVFGPDKSWNSLDTEERAEVLPRLPLARDMDFRNWVLSIDPKDVEKTLLRYGINPGASVTRLEAVQEALQTDVQVLASEVVNSFWVL